MLLLFLSLGATPFHPTPLPHMIYVNPSETVYRGQFVTVTLSGPPTLQNKKEKGWGGTFPKDAATFLKHATVQLAHVQV